MKVLKGLGVSFLSFILFLCLMVFSLAFMLNGTVLSRDFVSDQVDKIPISDIARDFGDEVIASQITQDMPFLKDVALDVLEKQEPWIKKELKAAADAGYDYFLGETDKLNIVIPLTELKEDLKNTLWDEVGIVIREQTAGMTEAQTSAYLQDIIRQIPTDILPSELSLLPSGQLNTYIEQYLRESAGLSHTQSGDPEYVLLKTLIDQYINTYLGEFIDEVPNSYTVDSATLGADTMDSLSTAKTVVGYFQTYYIWMIILIIVLAALIFLINMNIRSTARALGINLLIFGVLDLVGIIVTRTLPVMDWVSNIFEDGIPDSLTTWITGLTNDITSVALPLSIGLLVAGVLLLVVSFLPKFWGVKAEE